MNRLLSAIPVVLGITIIVFLIISLIVQDDAPWVFVANWKQNAVTNSSVKNFNLQPSFFLLLKDVEKN